MNGNKKDRIASSNDLAHGASTNHPNLKRTLRHHALRQPWVIGKMLIGVTEEISAMCGAIDSCCDERVAKFVKDSIGKQILHGPYPDQPEDSG